ncbi:hypothetical protein AK812_SmicGene48519, partial [Symbiodinium microadriaticum]
LSAALGPSRGSEDEVCRPHRCQCTASRLSINATRRDPLPQRCACEHSPPAASSGSTSGHE